MTTWSTRFGNALRPTLVDKVERDHRESDAAFLRRRIASGITLVVGAVLLGFSLNVQPDSQFFYPLTIALAATWMIGGFASGPLHLGRINFRGELRRPVIMPILLGLVTAVVDPAVLDRSLQDLVTALSAAPVAAVRATKAVLRGALRHDPETQRRLERETQVPLIRGMLGPG